MDRKPAAAIVASAAVLVGVAVHEGYKSAAYQDVGGVYTVGYGQADGVKKGDVTDPVKALVKLEKSMDENAKGMVQCIKVPVSQGEYDAYLDFTYNVGVSAFCHSTLNKKLNDMDYAGACKELLKWVTAGGKPQPGLIKRRQEEYEKCSAQSNSN